MASAIAGVGEREYCVHCVRRAAMNSLTVALALWNGLLLVTLVVLIRRREQVMRRSLPSFIRRT